MAVVVVTGVADAVVVDSVVVGSGVVDAVVVDSVVVVTGVVDVVVKLTWRQILAEMQSLRFRTAQMFSPFSSQVSWLASDNFPRQTDKLLA